MLLIHTHTHTHTQTRWGLSWNEDHYPRVMMDMYGPGRTWGTHCMLWIRTELPPLQIPMRARARVCVCVCRHTPDGRKSETEKEREGQTSLWLPHIRERPCHLDAVCMPVMAALLAHA